MVKYVENIYYYTKNQMRGLCVGGDTVILLDENRHLPRIFRNPRFFFRMLDFKIQAKKGKNTKEGVFAFILLRLFYILQPQNS